MLLCFLAITQALIAGEPTKTLGLYIICNNTESEKDDAAFNKFVGTSLQANLGDKFRKSNIIIMPLNARLPKHKVFNKHSKQFYIDEKKIDSIGQLNGCNRVMILYYGYSKRIAKIEDAGVYDRVAFYGVIADPKSGVGKNYRYLYYKRYLKGNRLGLGPSSLQSKRYYTDFLADAANSVHDDMISGK